MFRHYQRDYRNRKQKINGHARPVQAKNAITNKCKACDNPLVQNLLCAECTTHCNTIKKIGGKPPVAGKNETDFTRLCDDFRSHINRGLNSQGVMLEDEEQQILRTAAEFLKQAARLKQGISQKLAKNNNMARHAWLWSAVRIETSLGGVSEMMQAEGEEHGIEKLVNEVRYVERNPRIKSLLERPKPKPRHNTVRKPRPRNERAVSATA